MIQLQEKHKWPTAKSSQSVSFSICSSVVHLGHKMQALGLPLHFKRIHFTVTANGAEENNIKYEQSKISGQQSSAQNEV